jgi:hypothetical protein
MGEAQGVAYSEQVKAMGGANIAMIETLKVIGEKGVRITPDIMSSGNGDGGGGIGNLLLLNLFKEQMKPGNGNGNGKPPENGKPDA